jgi:hypothetical protein
MSFLINPFWGSTYISGASLSASYSLSRKLVAGYGGPLATITSGNVALWNDQSGAARNMTPNSGSTAAVNAGPNSRLACDFNSSSLISAVTLANFIQNTEGWFAASVIFDSFPTNLATVYDNSSVFSDSGGYVGLPHKSNGGSPLLFAYNWDGNSDSVSAPVVANQAYVVSWRHQSGVLYVGVNHTESAGVASGNTQVMTGSLKLGIAAGTQTMDGKIFEFVSYSAVPDLATRTAVIENLKNWVGA